MIHLGEVDVMRAIWWFSRARQSLEEGDMEGHKRLSLVNKDWTHPDLADKWGTIKALINKAKIKAENNGYRLLRADVETLAPNTAMPWINSLPDEAIVYVVLTAPYPRCMIYEDVAVAALVPGQIWAVGSNTTTRAIANLGGWDAVLLVLTLRKVQDE